MSIENSDLTLDEKSYTTLIYTLFTLLILVFFLSAGLFIPTANDLVFQYGQESGMDPKKVSWIHTQIQNGRYVPAAIGALMKAYGYDYFYAIGFWIFGFAVALWFCTLEFIRYVKLPITFTPWCTLAIGLHGFWAELMQLLTAYLYYATGLMASGLALLCARLTKNQPRLCASLVALCTFGALASYQPMALILLFAANLALIRDVFFEPEKKMRRSMSSIIPLYLGFIAGSFLFFTANYFISYLSPSISFVLGNIQLKRVMAGLLLFSIFIPITNVVPYHLIFPFHERILYGLAQIGVLILVLRITPSRSRFLAFGALIISLLLSGGFIMGDWSGSPYIQNIGNMAPTAFFHVGLIMILGLSLQSIIGPRYPKWTLRQLSLGSLLAFVFLSAGSQFSLLMERWQQYNQDYAIASHIVAGLRESGHLIQGAKIAVVSENWGPISQLHPLSVMPFRTSAFLPSYGSAVPLLSRVSGFTLTSVSNADLARLAQLANDKNGPIYEAFCHGAHAPWEIREKDHMTLVCLPSMEGKRGAP